MFQKDLYVQHFINLLIEAAWLHSKDQKNFEVQGRQETFSSKLNSMLSNIWKALPALCHKFTF